MSYGVGLSGRLLDLAVATEAAGADWAFTLSADAGIVAGMFSKVQSIFRIVLVVGLAVWFGGLVQLLMDVTTLFRAFPKDVSDVAVQAAPELFHQSQWVQAIAGLMTLASVVVMRIFACSRGRKWLMRCVVGALVMSATSTLWVTPKIDALRESDQRGSPSFRYWHGVSNMVYLAQLTLVGVSLVLLPNVLRVDTCELPRP